jgi:hypothetical protein
VTAWPERNIFKYPEVESIKEDETRHGKLVEGLL